MFGSIVLKIPGENDRRTSELAQPQIDERSRRLMARRAVHRESDTRSLRKESRGKGVVGPATRSSANLTSTRVVLALGVAAFCFAGLALAPRAFADTASGAARPPTMMVPGQFSVSPTGDGTYSIPISVPPGTAGMVPALSLNYTSSSGDGIVGLGWTLAGLPVITRCPRTVAQDTVHGGVNYDANDRFCIQGQRLIVISGTYGADGAQYRTEIEGFSEIISHGTAGTGPSWFELHLKTGPVLQFGDTTDSRILAVGKTTARVWAVNQVTDTKGNYFKVTYTNDTTNGQFYPTRIDYTGNSGLATYNSVRFTYNTSRPDVTPTYQAGSLIQTKVLLTNIKTYNSNTVVNNYELGYELGTALHRSRLTSVTLCDSGSHCLAPTTFGWQGSRDTLTITATANSLAQGAGIISGDFNGDGLLDAVVLTTNCPTGGVVYYGSQSGTFSSANMTAQYDYYATDSTTPIHYNSTACFEHADSVIGDINADGLSDLVIDIDSWEYINPGGLGWHWLKVPSGEVLRNNGSGSLVQVSADGAFTYPMTLTRGYNGVPSDFNGDGRSDAFEQLANGIGYAFFSNGDGTYTQDGGHPGYSGIVTLSADFDGDGCSDILGEEPTNAILYFCQPAVSQVSIPDWTGDTLVLGDFNGDGKTDILVVSSTGATLYLSTGTGISTAYAIPNSSTWHNYTIVAGDWNGNGKTDIALISQTSGQPHLIFLSTGTGFTQVATIANTDTSVTATAADWNNDGADDLWIQKPSGDTEYTFSYVPEYLTTISNGLGATTTITYNRINKNGSLYTKGTGSTYPVKDVDAPQYVVASVATSNGIGGTYSWNYSYTAERMDQSGRGFLGFQLQAVTDSETGIIRTTTYRQDFPYIGLVASQTTTSGSVTLSSVTNTYAANNLGGTRNFVYLTQSVVTRNDLNGSAFPTVTTNYTYDSYGNPLTVSQTLPDGSSKTTTNTFNNDTTNWILGQIATTNIQSVVGASNLTRHFSFAHQSGSGLFTQEITEPNTPSLKMQADIVLDAYGNRTGVTLSGQGITTRTRSAGYDTKGEFPTSLSNALSQTTTYAYSASFGGPTSVTDPNGLITTWSYDTLGRYTLVTKPDGTKASVSYFYCSGINGGTLSCPTYAAYTVESKPLATDGVTQNGPISWVYYDALSRILNVDIQGFDGPGTGCTLSAPCWIRTATQYDSLGHVAQTSRPYFISGGTAKWTVYTHDTLARVTKATFPDASKTTYTFSGLVTTVTNNLNQTTTTTRNDEGPVALVKDPAGHTTAYTYDAFGDLLSTTDPSGNVISNTFDLRGRKLSTSDPDMGTWQYGYDVLNELVSQTDAKNENIAITYDVLGRPLSRVEPGLTSNWSYDTAAYGIGKLTSATTSNGYSRVHTYDSYGRPTQAQLTIDGNISTVVTSYDANGRISTVTYPSGFEVQYVYTTLGYQNQITDYFSSQVYWNASARDAEFHLVQEIAGNGIMTVRTFNPNTGRIQTTQAGTDNAVANFAYNFDTIGNLTQRQDLNEGLTENFCYDELNRLTNSAISASSCTVGTSVKTASYDLLGNITAKSDIGTYSYPATGQAGPHAVTSITGTINGVVNPTFSYDLNGNMTAGAGRSVTYTAFNMAASVAQGSATLTYDYDPEHMRISQVAPEGTTVYVNDPGSGISLEKFIGASVTQWNEYLYGDGRMVGEHFTLSDSTTYIRYFIGDNLNSVSVLTDETGTVTERLSYDSWGKRRNPDGSDATGPITSATTRGFTGQEQIDDVGLINFNARIYDPSLGRFMSADTIVPGTYNGQSFNRYSYVLNRPLSLIDPTGHASYMCDATGCHSYQDAGSDGFDLYGDINPVYADGLDWLALGGGIAGIAAGEGGIFGTGWAGGGGFGDAFGDYYTGHWFNPPCPDCINGVIAQDNDSETVEVEAPLPIWVPGFFGSWFDQLTNWASSELSAIGSESTRGTLQIGFSGARGFTIPGTPLKFNGVGGFGVAVDTHLNFALYSFVGGSGGAENIGASEDAGLSIQVSDALTVDDLSQYYNNVSVHGGEGLGGSADYFSGDSQDGPVEGGGVTFGEAEGASLSIGGTETYVYDFYSPSNGFYWAPAK